jgi:hypothetical protein
VGEEAVVTLDGSGSSDPEGEELTYAWSGPDEVTLSSAAVENPTFTAPTQLVSNATLVFSLVVTDERGLASSSDTVTVTVTAGPNDAPAAEAGDDQTVGEEAVVTLDGSGSSDPEGEELTYAWSGPDEVTLSSAAAQRPTFTAPVQLAVNAVFEFSLVVTDARGLASSSDTVTITVTAEMPVMGAGGCVDGTFVSDPGSNTGLLSDCVALIAIRNHWTEDSGNADLPGTHPLRTWGVGESVAISDWAGVFVSNQRVTGLTLRASNISGTLPTQLGDLTSLTSLSLYNNELTGEMPEELGNLTSLTHLYLYDNGLTGEIPEELGNLTSLTHLRLYNNGLTGEIPEELGNLTSLAVLHLSHNGLTGSTSLTRLYLYNNEFRRS